MGKRLVLIAFSPSCHLKWFSLSSNSSYSSTEHFRSLVHDEKIASSHANSQRMYSFLTSKNQWARMDYEVKVKSKSSGSDVDEPIRSHGLWGVLIVSITVDTGAIYAMLWRGRLCPISVQLTTNSAADPRHSADFIYPF